MSPHRMRADVRSLLATSKGPLPAHTKQPTIPIPYCDVALLGLGQAAVLLITSIQAVGVIAFLSMLHKGAETMIMQAACSSVCMETLPQFSDIGHYYYIASMPFDIVSCVIFDTRGEA